MLFGNFLPWLVLRTKSWETLTEKLQRHTIAFGPSDFESTDFTKKFKLSTPDLQERLSSANSNTDSKGKILIGKTKLGKYLRYELGKNQSKKMSNKLRNKIRGKSRKK